MKKVCKEIYNNFLLIFSNIFEILLAIFNPIIELVVSIFNIFNQILDFRINTDNIYKYIKKTAHISIFSNFIVLFLSEIFLLFKILKGQIVFYNSFELVIYTLLILSFSFIFVRFLNIYYKSKTFNYFIYFQILFLLPLIFVYWVANIEGHTLYLKNLTPDQWINIFNTIIIYFSGCIIGIATLYKTNTIEKK